ncbi:bifunctional enoyl-CoA hydratase/phosphate acetyltransferase [uncultured Ilyobacter sp.]|uniref:bifunctional enoyl-CoA hydratase/phosphate acetyltransferase n=1 Tax=uncultured Ilyobacter sp. TaxID=544433 RepID=UPI0029C79E77|nr:bifunctional enoyl-CoA hydratase/phosphate acetyltransferase [uncultured Ilyobacter sp.]
MIKNKKEKAMAIKNFEELIRKIKKIKRPKKVVVASAQDRHTLEALIKVEKDGIVESILIGNKNKIKELLSELDFEKNDDNIIDSHSDTETASKAVEVIRDERADFLMKGKIQTAELLRAVVDRDMGLRTGRIMSHITLLEIPTYHKLVAVSDGGMVINPNLEEKKQILKNAVDVFLALGYENPKVAALAAVETVNPQMQESVHGEILKNMNLIGEIKNCIVEGPISYDLAMCEDSARIKEYKSTVAGDADILLVPNITVGNILSKSLVYSGGSRMAGFITGARVPIVLTSRGATAEEKYLSLLLCAAMFK